MVDIAHLVERIFVADKAVGSNPTIHPMATLNQIIRHPRRLLKETSVNALKGQPQAKGMCLKVLIQKPKKPNSAMRKIAKVKLSTGITISAYIPGEGHNLQEHGSVLVRGGRVPDLPGVKYKCIRGKYDLGPVANRSTSRSKYGKKRPL